MFGKDNLDEDYDKAFNTLKHVQTIVNKAKQQMKNPDETCFVAVCIAEFLSMYETERLMEELMNQEIDIRNLVVNNVLYPEDKCELCQARKNM